MHGLDEDVLRYRADPHGADEAQIQAGSLCYTRVQRLDATLGLTSEGRSNIVQDAKTTSK